MNYPNGQPYKENKTLDGRKSSSYSSNIEYGGRGMSLEKDIEHSNAYYLKSGIAVIHKKPTPVQIVNVHYPKRSKAVINEAYFRTPSTTDYNGVYNGYYIDFEAKETKNKTSFPLKNIHTHQLEHMKECCEQGGIAFVIFYFSSLKEYYLLEYKMIEEFIKESNSTRQSIPLTYIQEKGKPIQLSLQMTLNYLDAVDALL